MILQIHDQSLSHPPEAWGARGTEVHVTPVPLVIKSLVSEIFLSFASIDETVAGYLC